ncbi:MAG: DUF2969 family protein [Lactovum sp.]
MSKKETEIIVKEIDNGVELFVGKKKIGSVKEEGSNFKAFSDKELLSTVKSYSDAEEFVIRHYNLSL